MLSGAHEALFDAEARIEAAWPFPMSPTPERLAEAIAENLDRLPLALRPYFERLTEDEKDTLYEGGWRAEEILSEICGKLFSDGILGWLGIAATPVFTPTSSGGASFSWGHYHTQLIFATSGDDLMASAAEWAEVNHQCDTGARDSDSGSQSENSRSEVEAEGPQSGGAAASPNPSSNRTP